MLIVFIHVDVIFHDHTFLAELVDLLERVSRGDDELSQQGDTHRRRFVVLERQSQRCHLVADGQTSGFRAGIDAQRNGERISFGDVAFPRSSMNVNVPMHFFHFSVIPVNLDVIFDIGYSGVDGIPTP